MTPALTPQSHRCPLTTITITSLTLPPLKKVKNTVIGNPLAKFLIAQDDAFIRMYVPPVSFLCSVLMTQKPGCRPTETPNHSTNDALRLEVAHAIASLAYGSEPSLAALLAPGRTCPPLRPRHVHLSTYSLTFSSSTSYLSSSPALRSTLARALRAVIVALADIVRPRWFRHLCFAEDFFETVRVTASALWVFQRGVPGTG